MKTREGRKTNKKSQKLDQISLKAEKIMSTQRNNVHHNHRKGGRKTFCKICFDVGKPEAVYTSHFPKDVPGPKGKVVCPTLLKEISCRYCRQLGHTKNHCEKLKAKEARMGPKAVAASRKARREAGQKAQRRWNDALAQAADGKRGGKWVPITAVLAEMPKGFRPRRARAPRRRRRTYPRTRVNLTGSRFDALAAKTATKREPVAAPKPMAPRRAAGVWGQRAATYRPTAAELAWLQQQIVEAQEQTAFENEGNAFFASVDLAQCLAEQMDGENEAPFAAEAAAAQAIAAAASSARWEDNEAADSDAEEDLSFLDAPLA